MPKRPAARAVASPAACVSLALLLGGAAGYRVLEGWPAVDCVYASAGVLTTVGIVLSPRTAAGTAFTAALNLASLGAAGAWLAEIAAARAAGVRRALALGDAPSPRADALAAAAAATVPWAAATLFFARAEGWPLGDAAFFALACATGLGMADREPRTPAGRLALAVYVFLNMGVALNALAAVGAALQGAAVRAAAGACKADRAGERRSEASSDD